MSHFTISKRKKIIAALSAALSVVGLVFGVAFLLGGPAETLADPTNGVGQKDLLLHIEKKYDYEEESLQTKPPIYAGDRFYYILEVTNDYVFGKDNHYTGSGEPPTSTTEYDTEPNIPDVYTTLVVYDELSQWLVNAKVESISITSGDYEDPYVEYTDTMIKEACRIQDFALDCRLRQINLRSRATSNDLIRIKVSAEAVYNYNSSEGHKIVNTAYVFAQSYIDGTAGAECVSLDQVKSNDAPKRCRSTIDFVVRTPKLSIAKEVDKNGGVYCIYKDKDGVLHDGSEKYDADNNRINNEKKDITNESNYKEACKNEDEKLRKPNQSEVFAAWGGLSPAEKEAYILANGNDSSKAFNAFSNDYSNNSANWVVEVSATLGTVVNETVQAGDTITYEIKVRNDGDIKTKMKKYGVDRYGIKSETSKDVYIGTLVSDTLDPFFFEKDSIVILPVTGGMDCSITEETKVLCDIQEPIAPGEEAIFKIRAIVKSNGDIYNRAYVGGGADLNCPIEPLVCASDDDPMLAEKALTRVRSVELHINKESRMMSSGTSSSSSSEGGEGESASSDSGSSTSSTYDKGVTFLKGQEGEYIIKVTNEGEVDTNGRVVVHDTIPEEFNVDRVQLTYDYEKGLCELRASHELYCRLYESSVIAARGGIWEISVKVTPDEDIKITPDNKHVVNYAYVYGGNDKVCKDESIEAEIMRMVEDGEKEVDNPYDRCYDFLGSDIVSPKLRIASSVSTQQVLAGQEYQYHITVTNDGDHNTIGDTTVIDYLPKNVVADTISLPEGCEYDEAAGIIKCTIPGGLKKKDSVTLTFNITNHATSGTLTNKAITFNPYDPDCTNIASANNSARCHTYLYIKAVSPLMEINTYASSMEVYTGSKIVYTIIARNIGNAATTDVTVISDEIPSEIKMIGLRSSMGTCKPDLHSFECVLPAGIQPGDYATISVLGRVTTESDEITNTADLYGGGDPECISPTAASSSSDDGESTASNAVVKRCSSSASIRAVVGPNLGAAGIGASNAGVLESLQVVGTVAMLGVASYAVLNFRRNPLVSKL